MGCCDQVAEILSILQGSGTGAPVFAGSNPGSGTELSYYGEQIVVAGLRPIDYTLESGSIPTGTTLNGSTGLISGASPTAGTYTFTIRATNTLGSATQEFTIYIAGLAPSLVYPVPGAYGLDPVISDNLILFFEGTDVMQQYSAYAARPGWTGTVATFAPIGSYTGGYLGTQPITYSVSGSLPDGITIDALTGALVGIPTLASASYYQLVFRASNAYGSISARYTFQVISLP